MKISGNAPTFNTVFNFKIHENSIVDLRLGHCWLKLIHQITRLSLGEDFSGFKSVIKNAYICLEIFKLRFAVL